MSSRVKFPFFKKKKYFESDNPHETSGKVHKKDYTYKVQNKQMGF